MTLTDAKEIGGIVNESLDKLGYSGGTHINVGDDATVESIEAGLKAIGMLPQEVVNQLLNQVEIVLIFRNYGTMFSSSKNPTRRFWRDAVNFGGGLEDLYHEILEPISGISGIWAEDYANGDEGGNKALNNAKYHFGYHGGNVQKKFHTNKEKFDIALSLSDLEISKIFTLEGFERFRSVKLANMNWSAEIEIMSATIREMVKMVTDRKIVVAGGHNVNTETGIANTVESIRSITDAMKMPSTMYNFSNINTMSDEEDLYLVTTPEFMNRIRVHGAANAYNLGEYMIKNNVIMLPAGTSFGTTENGETVYALLVDRRAIVMAFRYWSMRPFYPTGSDFQNYFLKVEYIHGYNEFFNAVAIAGDAIDDVKKNEGGYLVVSSGDDEVIEHDGFLASYSYDSKKFYYGVTYLKTNGSLIVKFNGVDVTSGSSEDRIDIDNIVAGTMIEIGDF